MLALICNVRHTRPGVEEILATITDELLETGLKDDDEPNARGLTLDDLMDSINRSFLSDDGPG